MFYYITKIHLLAFSTIQPNDPSSDPCDPFSALLVSQPAQMIHLILMTNILFYFGQLLHYTKVRSLVVVVVVAAATIQHHYTHCCCHHCHHHHYHPGPAIFKQEMTDAHVVWVIGKGKQFLFKKSVENDLIIYFGDYLTRE